MNIVPNPITALLASLALSLLTVPAPTAATDLNGQRAQFIAAAAALAAGRSDDFQRRRRALDGYVLAPYLDYFALRRDLRNLSGERAERFLDQERDHQLGLQFRREWLSELGRRGDWRGFRRFDDAEAATGLHHRCLRLRAALALDGNNPATRGELLNLWAHGQSLPDSCDPALRHGREQNWIGSEQVAQRLRLAIEAGNTSLASYLARQLPEARRSDGERLARAVSDPAASLQAADSWPDSAGNREAAALALQRRARQNVDDAIDHWQRLQTRLRFDDEQRGAIQRELALYAAVAYRDDAEDWYRRVPDTLRDEQLAEWQLRVRLARLDWSAVRALIEAESSPLPDSPRRRYWHARALDELGQAPAARLLFQDLAGEAHFHGFLAADRIGKPYALCALDAAEEPTRVARLQANVDLQRALELHAVDRRSEAVRAWEHGLRDASLEDRVLALHWADARGWYDRAVFNLRNDDELRYYRLRFPVAERPVVDREAQANGLDGAWVYALIRAESAWQPHARSHADAHGLMQLLPATGQRMARELGVPWNGTRTLLDPTTNIRLGTRYMARQAERFGNSPWLASAAYNAGPAPVERWLAQRGHLPADVFIETIPYHETRAYVPRILAFSVIYDWRLHGKARPLSSRLPDPGQRYAGVPALDAARPFACAASTAATDAAAQAVGPG